MVAQVIFLQRMFDGDCKRQYQVDAKVGNRFWFKSYFLDLYKIGSPFQKLGSILHQKGAVNNPVFSFCEKFCIITFVRNVEHIILDS